MTLLVDVGNSAIKWARLQSGRLTNAQWLLHRRVPDVAAQLTKSWQVFPGGTHVLACNVAGDEVVAAVEQSARSAGLGSVRWVQTQSSFEGSISLANGYRDPLQLGADRWHCMLGACSLAAEGERVPGVVVVNAGTATTVDCIETVEAGTPHNRFTGRFIGGTITPGVRLMLESLARETAALPAASGGPVSFPDHTDAAIITGVLDAQTGTVLQLRHRFAAQLRAAPLLMLTGGHAATLAARLAIDAVIEDNLVLRGLALRAEQSRES